MEKEEGKFSLHWYNPRTGEFVGKAGVIEGGNDISLGEPPTDANEDWIILIQKMHDSSAKAGRHDQIQPVIITF